MNLNSNGKTNDYLAYSGEVDANAREFAEFYKRKFPNQKFDIIKFKFLEDETKL